MKIRWRKSAIESLIELDRWRKTIELPAIATYLKEKIETYFQKQEFIFYIPGKQVFITNMPVDLRMVLIPIGKSPPYKVFFKVTATNIEIFLIRHPHQKPLN